MTIEKLGGDVRAAPTKIGTVRLIVRRPAVDEREVVSEARLDVEANGGSLNGHTDFDYTNYYQTMPSNRVELGIWLESDRMRSLDISEENLPAVTRLLVGEAEIQVSAKPHTGCAKFSARFGKDALRLVSSPEGRALRLRGMNARVTKSGTVRVGDRIACAG